MAGLRIPDQISSICHIYHDDRNRRACVRVRSRRACVRARSRRASCVHSNRRACVRVHTLHSNLFYHSHHSSNPFYRNKALSNNCK